MKKIVTLFQRNHAWHHPDGRMVKIKRKDFTREKP